MPNQPRSYDEIVRGTVPDPDSSWRPTPGQEKDAREGFRATDAGEQSLQATIVQALTARDFDLSGVNIEVDGGRVTLRGRVADSATLNAIPAAIHQIDGVEDVVDYLVVGAPAT